jgi:hypothetical protein
MRRFLFLLLFTPAVLAAAPQGLDALAGYAGRWKAEIHRFKTAYSDRGEDLFELRNDCWRSAGFFVCDQFVGGESKALLVFLYDARSGGYASYPIAAAGVPVVHPGALVLQGPVWTFPWDTEEAGKITHFRVVNTWESADSILFRQEYSADGKQWTLMAEGHETRLKH